MKNVLQLLERTADCFGEKTAFADENSSYTWAQTLAAVRRAGSGIALALPEGGAVAICMERSADCVLAMLGVVAGGGFYAVLDPAQPESRAKSILAQLAPKAVLCDEAHREAAAAFGLPLLLWETLRVGQADAPRLAAIRAHSVETDLMYVLFTSGSTGAPKGVAISHRNVLAYSEWFAREFGIDENTVFGNQTPFYFSMSVSDLFGALRTGACVQVLPKRLFSFPVQLLEYLNKRKINTIYWVPSALGIVASWKALDYAAVPALQKVLFAGEVMPTPHLNYWRGKLPKAEFANLYGPTETTDICAFYRVEREFADSEPLPIGRACDNCGLLVLDEENHAAAKGQMGELCARGNFLAAGYYADAVKTAERFTQNPLNDKYPEVIYHTGDLVKWNEAGELVYLGRRDHQIKHMGYRIEPGEVETAAYTLEKLEQCVCLYDAPSDRLLLAYQGKKNLDEALPVHLRAALPPYMQPAKVFRLRTMPHNANGKIDRAAVMAAVKQMEEAKV